LGFRHPLPNGSATQEGHDQNIQKLKKASRPAKRKRATSRAFPYERVAKLWAQRKTIPENAKAIGRVGKAHSKLMLDLHKGASWVKGH